MDSIVPILMHRRIEMKKKGTKKRDILIKLGLLLLQQITTLCSQIAFKKSGRLWTLPELLPPISPGFFENVVPLYDDRRFQKKFRLSRETFQNLCEMLHGIIGKKDTTYRDAICTPKRILIALSILKSNCDAGTIADLFKVGKSTVGFILIDFCTALGKLLFKELLNFPATELQRDIIAEDFNKKWNFPGVMGALDGCHIPIKKPKIDGEDYFNYKKFFSIVLLAMVDSKYCFRYANIGQAGSCHDSSVFRCSTLNTFFNQNSTDLHIIADGAFPLLNWIMKPYNCVPLTPKQVNFNYHLSSARMVVENAFGRLKGRWRILNKRLEYSLEHSKVIVIACVILHNLCENKGDHFHEEWLEGVTMYSDETAYPDRGLSSAKLKRDRLSDQLFRNN